MAENIICACLYSKESISRSMRENFSKGSCPSVKSLPIIRFHVDGNHDSTDGYDDDLDDNDHFDNKDEFDNNDDFADNDD